MILVMPAGFERDIVRDRRAPVQLMLNAEDGAAAGVTQARIARTRDRRGATRARSAPSGRDAAAAIEVRRRGWYNPELNYRDYMVPGILVQLLTLIGTLLTAMNIVREKEIGTLDQLNVTPVTRSAFIAAKLIPLWAIALVELAVGLADRALRLRRADVREPGHRLLRGEASTWSPRSASGSGSRR